MKNFEAVRLWGLALNYWRLTRNASDELVKAGNPESMLYEGWGNPTDEEREEHFKWADTNIVEPLLFNFYHGIELSLKSLIAAKGIELKASHKLSQLLSKFTSLYPNSELIEFYEKYIVLDKSPGILKTFCAESGITMDYFFQSLKYPSSTKGVWFNHSTLRSHDKDGIELFQDISNELDKVKAQFTTHIEAECIGQPA
ncbi:HEPN domain-containing protein [Microbulbifer elongatus]|uniref:HEPN domain-containing protein n=1 Tax=Microbulbifer elongatus TaxID=86173 RepID=UPI001E3BC528|nr:HEPN domain-containing protein [Microbulbifer elongatus]